MSGHHIPHDHQDNNGVNVPDTLHLYVITILPPAHPPPPQLGQIIPFPPQFDPFEPERFADVPLNITLPQTSNITHPHPFQPFHHVAHVPKDHELPPPPQPAHHIPNCAKFIPIGHHIPVNTCCCTPQAHQETGVTQFDVKPFPPPPHCHGHPFNEIVLGHPVPHIGIVDFICCITCIGLNPLVANDHTGVGKPHKPHKHPFPAKLSVVPVRSRLPFTFI